MNQLAVISRCATRCWRSVPVSSAGRGRRERDDQESRNRKVAGRATHLGCAPGGRRSARGRGNWTSNESPTAAAGPSVIRIGPGLCLLLPRVLRASLRALRAPESWIREFVLRLHFTGVTCRHLWASPRVRERSPSPDGSPNQGRPLMRRIRIFVSSPGDCVEQRKLLDEVVAGESFHVRRDMDAMVLRNSRRSAATRGTRPIPALESGSVHRRRQCHTGLARRPGRPACGNHCRSRPPVPKSGEPGVIEIELPATAMFFCDGVDEDAHDLVGAWVVITAAPARCAMCAALRRAGRTSSRNARARLAPSSRSSSPTPACGRR